jgi:hypothetical protein
VTTIRRTVIAAVGRARVLLLVRRARIVLGLNLLGLAVVVMVVVMLVVVRVAVIEVEVGEGAKGFSLRQELAELGVQFEQAKLRH